MKPGMASNLTRYLDCAIRRRKLHGRIVKKLLIRATVASPARPVDRRERQGVMPGVKTFCYRRDTVTRVGILRTAIMTWAALNARGMLAAVAAGLTPLLCHAYSLDEQLDCKSSAHEFVGALLDEQYIDPDPMRVEANSVNVFRPVHGSDLMAFGYRVYAVLGYQQDDGMFRQGSGRPVGDSAYGVILFGPSETVEVRARQAGSDAAIRPVVPLVMTAVFCNGH
jgi:hypothetical protein